MENSGIWKKQLAFLAITDEDVRIMGTYREIFTREADAFVGRFYEHITQCPELISIINANTTVEKLKIGVPPTI